MCKTQLSCHPFNTQTESKRRIKLISTVIEVHFLGVSKVNFQNKKAELFNGYKLVVDIEISKREDE